MKKLKVTAVSYLNTKPLLYGLFKSNIADQIELELNIPSECARKLKKGEVDLGLVPVAIIPELTQSYIISDYCIGTIGAVKTVALFGACPVDEMTHIYLDFHSRTSVELIKVLTQEYWKTAPIFLSAQEGYENQIKGKTGGLIIGDRTIGQHERFPYVYDLGEAWMQYTGLPFVFAAWVSNKPLDPQFVNVFNQAMEKGISKIPELIYLLPSPSPQFDLNTYFTHYISYHLDTAKRKALTLFLEKIKQNTTTNLTMSVS